MIEMKVAGIALDAASHSPLILLRDPTDRRQLPIYISREQASSIITVLENQPPPRPLTHDLFVNLLEAWDMTLERVVIHSLRDNTFYALLTLVQGDTRQELRCPPQ
jgi:bifunctional DNase/RNase